MTLAELEALQDQVLAAVFGLSFLFGVIAQRTHFCTMGALSDVVNMGDWTRLRMWVLAIGVAILGFNAMVALGWVTAADTFYAAPEMTWLSALVGGALFGIGMVLASGCGSKTLLRVGAGNLKSVVVFVVLAISAYATIRGLTAVWRVNSVDRIVWTLPPGQDLPSLATSLFGIATPVAAAWIGLLFGLLCIAWVVARPEGRGFDVWLGGVGIGAAVVGVWWVSGQLGHVIEHPETLEDTFIATATRRMESLSFVAPAAQLLDWLIYYSDASKRLTLGAVSMLGILAGSFAYSMVTRTFRWEGFRNARDTGHHLIGATLMGVGGVTALGCTIGQGISGLSTLSIGSVLAVAGIVAGGVAALRWQIWQVERGAA
ncbi:YeeE/YedE family protein [Piscinibacter sakaiensis]|uniref:YeeE/YedE family protein n=1 Tax=Piscinibacter sakaiensis TaxID=1547922 RepID=UPI003AAFCDA8